MIGELKKKRSRNERVDENLLSLLQRIETDRTKKVLLIEHQDFNQLFQGLTPTEVLGKLRCEILNENYKVSVKENGNNGKGIGRKKLFARFFLNASRFNEIKFSNEELEKIDKELDKRCVVPAGLMKLFKMKTEDLEYYLKENFLYPGFERFFPVWDILSKESFEKNKDGPGKYHKLFIKNRL